MHAALVKYYYVDGTFNGTDWDARFQAALAASAEAPSAAAVRESAAELLQALGDPYTRILSGASASISDAERNGQARPHTSSAPHWRVLVLCHTMDQDPVIYSPEDVWQPEPF